MAAEFAQDYETFDLGDFTLQHGDTLKDAKLAYKTFGELNADKSNAIVYPTWYSGSTGITSGWSARTWPSKVLYHHSKHARQRALELTEQHLAPVR